MECGIVLKTDASAAKGISNRRGLSKVKHLDVNQLWLQNKVADGEIVVIKAPGKDNLADALTKYVTGEEITQHVAGVGGEIRRGRRSMMQKLRSTKR